MVKKIIFGTLVVLGVLPFLLGIFGMIDEIRGYLVNYRLDTLDLIMSFVLIVFGGMLVSSGTVFLDRKKTFLENAWLAGVLIAFLGLFPFFFDVITRSLNVFETTFNVTLMITGGYIFFVSRRKK
ncbi:hypothetical protein ACFL56_00465 [Candidatus Margulisiibacteriota bacterium]